MRLPPPRSTLFPYTTLFRSQERRGQPQRGEVFGQGHPMHNLRAENGEAERIALAKRSKINNRLRSEEHTSELQSQSNLVCRLLLEKKNPRPPPPMRQFKSDA